MNFQIPQFIDVEDKIVGPLSLRQFLYLAGAGVTSFLLFFLFQFWLWLTLTVILGAIAIAAAFIKYNGQPLPRIALQAFGFLWKPRLYVWQREAEFREVEIKGKSFEVKEGLPSVRKLWQELLTSKSPIPKREKRLRIPVWEQSSKDRFQIWRKASGAKEAARRIDYR